MVLHVRTESTRGADISRSVVIHAVHRGCIQTALTLNIKDKQDNRPHRHR